MSPHKPPPKQSLDGAPSRIIRLVDYYAAVDFYDWAANDDASDFVLVIVVGTALVDVSAAAVFFGLARG